MSQQHMDELDVVDPFLNVLDDQIKKETSERLRYFHLKGTHLKGLSKSEIHNTLNSGFVFKEGMIFTKRVSRKKKNVIPNIPTDINETTVENISKGNFNISSFTKEVRNLGYYIVPPIPLRQKIIELYHRVKTNYAGLNVIEVHLRKKYWWKNMRIDISNYLRICEVCLDLKCKTNAIDDRPIRMQEYSPFNCFSIDIAFVSKSKGYVGYMLIIEAFTKYLWVNAIKYKDAETVEKHLSHVLNELQILHKIDFGLYHTRFRHDCGKEFVNSTVKKYLIGLA